MNGAEKKPLHDITGTEIGVGMQLFRMSGLQPRNRCRDNGSCTTPTIGKSAARGAGALPSTTLCKNPSMAMSLLEGNGARR